MQTTPYLFFPGTCREAMTFYAETLGAPEVFILDFASMPESEKANMPGMAEDAVMHAAITMGDFRLYASDDDSPPFQAMAGCNVHLTLGSKEEAHRVFEAFAEGGEVRMPMMEMFWVEAFGSLTDRFGTRWMISSPDRE